MNNVRRKHSLVYSQKKSVQLKYELVCDCNGLSFRACGLIIGGNERLEFDSMEEPLFARIRCVGREDVDSFITMKDISSQ
jgi:hypothetical protein